jgi:hypothetical protein
MNTTTRRVQPAKNDSGIALVDLVIGMVIFSIIAVMAVSTIGTAQRKALEARGGVEPRPSWTLDVLASAATLFGTAAVSIIVVLILTTAVTATRGHVRSRREAGLSQDMFTKGLVPA